MSKSDEVNQNNLTIARVGNLCSEHSLESTSDPEVDRCMECGIKVLREANK